MWVSRTLGDEAKYFAQINEKFGLDLVCVGGGFDQLVVLCDMGLTELKADRGNEYLYMAVFR